MAQYKTLTAVITAAALLGLSSHAQANDVRYGGSYGQQAAYQGAYGMTAQKPGLFSRWSNASRYGGGAEGNMSYGYAQPYGNTGYGAAGYSAYGAQAYGSQPYGQASYGQQAEWDVSPNVTAMPAPAPAMTMGASCSGTMQGCGGGYVSGGNAGAGYTGSYVTETYMVPSTSERVQGDCPAGSVRQADNSCMMTDTVTDYETAPQYSYEAAPQYNYETTTQYQPATTVPSYPATNQPTPDYRPYRK